MNSSLAPGQQFLVSVAARGSLAASERHDDYAVELYAVAEFFVNGQQHVIDNQKAVARMVRNEGNFVRVEAQIQRVQDAASHRHPEISLHVRGMIPQKRGHAVAAPQAEPGERIRQAARAAVKISPRGASRRPVRPARDDFGVSKNRARAFQQRRNRQRKIHH